MQWNNTFFTVLDHADGAVEKVNLFIGKIHFFAELFSATLYTFKIVLEKMFFVIFVTNLFEISRIKAINAKLNYDSKFVL